MTRRKASGIGAATLASTSLTKLLTGPAEAAVAPGATEGLGYFGRFGVTERMIRETLGEALARGGDYADLFFQHRVGNNYMLEDGAVNRAFTNVELGVGVRVVKGDQTGYGYTEDLTLEGVMLAAKTAAVIADGPARPGPAELHVTSHLPSRYPVKVSWSDVRPEQKLPLLTSLNERALGRDPRVRKVSVTFGDGASVILVADSQGRLVEDAQPMTLLYLSCVAEQDGQREQNTYGVAGRAGLDFYSPDRMERIVREAVDRTTILFEAVQAPAGEMPVVLAAGASGILLHEAIGHGMEADFNRKNVSIYSDKIGKPVARKFVNIVDEGTQEAARGALNVDDEGNPVDKTMLVQDGVLTTYLHDAISAKHYGVKPTGNGRREGYQYAPMPRMRSTYMLPGPHKKEEIIASVKRGIFCTNFSNGQVQIGAGDFTFYVKNGYLIEDGKLTKPIKDVNIIGNGPRVLEQIDMVADDLVIDEGGWTCGKDGQSVPVSQGIPTVRVASITVGGRNQSGQGMSTAKVSPELLEVAERCQGIALARGAREAAARAYKVRDVSVQWRDGRLEQIGEATTRGVSLQLYVDGRFSAVSSSDLRPVALETFIGDAVVMTRTLAEDPFRSLADPKLYAGQPNVDLHLEDPAYATVSPEQRRQVAQELEAAARAVKGSEHILSVTTGFGDNRSESVRVHSNGFTGARVDTSFSASAQVSVKDPDGRRPEDAAWATVRFVGEMPAAAEIGRTAADRTLARLGAKKAESSVLPMVLENRAAGRLVGALTAALSAQALQQKRSFLEGKVGQAVGSPRLTLTDDPLVPKGFGSRLFDGEGIAAKAMPIFEKGVLRNYYIDTYYGKKLQMAPTTGGSSNLELALGDKGQAELLEDVKHGILVTGFLGGNSNATTGDFSLGVQGFRIRAGRIAEPVAEMNISGNHLDFWQRLVAVGNDPWPYSSLRTPTLVFEGVQFAGV